MSSPHAAKEGRKVTKKREGKKKGMQTEGENRTALWKPKETEKTDNNEAARGEYEKRGSQQPSPIKSLAGMQLYETKNGGKRGKKREATVAYFFSGNPIGPN